MGELTGLQRAFINAWFGKANFNGTEAARLAGYGGDGANDNVWSVTASNLLKTPSVVEEVNRRFSLLLLSNDEALRGLAEAVQNGSKYRTKRVAGFVYLFSVLYKESDYINMYLSMTGAIYTAGAGAVIFGALYWRRSSTAGGWTAMIWGAVLAITGGVLQNIYSDSEWWPVWLTGMAIATISQLSSIGVFIIISAVMTNKLVF